jgi:Outer membrane efflux protein
MGLNALQLSRKISGLPRHRLCDRLSLIILPMKVPRFFVVVPLLTVSLWAAPPAASDLPLPERMLPWLDAILKTAVQQSPRMLSRALDLEIAENTRIMARSNILPSLGSSFSYYKASDDRADLSSRQNVTKVAYSLSLTQPLFYWGERRNNVRIGEIQQKISQGLYRDGYRLLAQELRGSYLHLIVQKLAVKRTGYNLGFTTKQLQQQEECWAKKVISEVEVVAARLTVEQARIPLRRPTSDQAFSDVIDISVHEFMRKALQPKTPPESTHVFLPVAQRGPGLTLNRRARPKPRAGQMKWRTVIPHAQRDKGQVRRMGG